MAEAEQTASKQSTKKPEAKKDQSKSFTSQECEIFDRKIKNMQKQDILPHISCIKNELTSKLSNKEKCWRYEIFSSGFSKNAPSLEKRKTYLLMSFLEVLLKISWNSFLEICTNGFQLLIQIS